MQKPTLKIFGCTETIILLLEGWILGTLIAPRDLYMLFSEVFSSCHFLLSWTSQRMLSEFQPSGHSRIFSLEGSAGEAKAEAKR